MTLAAVLEQVWKAAIPREVRMHICVRVAQDARVAGRSEASPSDPPTLSNAQSVSHLVSLFGFAGIGTFKKWLRDCGRQDLAARVSRLTKTRNAVAHPDVSLCDELRGLLGTGAARRCELGFAGPLHFSIDSDTDMPTESVNSCLIHTGCKSEVDSDSCVRGHPHAPTDVPVARAVSEDAPASSFAAVDIEEPDDLSGNDTALSVTTDVPPAAFRVTPGDPVMVRANPNSDHFIGELMPDAIVRGHASGCRVFLSTGGVVKLKYLEPACLPD